MYGPRQCKSCKLVERKRNRKKSVFLLGSQDNYDKFSVKYSIFRKKGNKTSEKYAGNVADISYLNCA